MAMLNMNAMNITNTEMKSLKSSLNSEELIGLTTTASLMEGKIGI